jgi:hypothetical protein
MCARPPVSHGFGEVSQGLLLHRKGACSKPRTRRPRFRELGALSDISWCWSPSRSVPVGLLQREVPHEPGVRAVPPKALLLSRCWIEPKSHVPSLRTGCDRNSEAETCGRPPIRQAATTARVLER